MRKFLGERRAVGAKCARSGRKSRTLFVTFGVMIHCIRVLVVMLFCSLQLVREEAGEVWGWRIDRGGPKSMRLGNVNPRPKALLIDLVSLATA
jgi:hypothetical protein